MAPSMLCLDQAKGKDIMWCTSCQGSVSWLDKSHGQSHLGLPATNVSKLNAGNQNQQPGLSALVQSPPEPQTPPQPSPSQSSSAVDNEALKGVQVQRDLKNIRTGLNHSQQVNEKIVSAVVQVGIAVNKLDHPFIGGSPAF